MNKITNTKNLYVVRQHAQPEIRYTAYDQYGKLEIEAPKGYEFTGEFRQGTKTERVLGQDDKVWNGADLSERLILKKIEETIPAAVNKSFIFKFVGNVAPKRGQFFDAVGTGRKFELAHLDFVDSFDTYERVEI